MRKRPKARWVQSKECLTIDGVWTNASFRKYDPDYAVSRRFREDMHAGTLYRPDHPHWGVLFVKNLLPHVIKYYPTKLAAKTAAMLSL